MFNGIVVKVFSKCRVYYTKVVLQHNQLRWEERALDEKKRRYRLNVKELVYVEYGKVSESFFTEYARDALDENCFSLVTKSRTSLCVEVKHNRNFFVRGFMLLIQCMKSSIDTGNNIKHTDLT